MRADARPSPGWRATFGSFSLCPEERLLQRDGVPVRLGGRALDLLIALVESAGTVVTKKELLARVWGDVIVEEGSLRFYMHAVRKALGDGAGGTRYIVNTANRGYTFVATVERNLAEGAPAAPQAPAGGTLLALGSAIVGREDEIEAVTGALLQRRFVSLVGAGGIGKTTVAVAAAHNAAGHFGGDVHFIDLSQLADADLVRTALASTVGLQNGLAELPAITVHLAKRRTLILLDCCEHVIAGAAELAESLVRHCPGVHLLTTSREPLRAEGEFVYRLQPLAYPPAGEGMTAAAALAYPAVRLFAERAAASSSGFELRDSDAPLASQLCRELDGIALAIELAAGRIEALGLKAITSHFDASVRLMWHGRRTAVPRHQTLGATLDWSFNLLVDDEKRLLRRLSVFTGTFSLDAALEVCCDGLDASIAIELLAGLVSKSLVNVDAGGAALRYGLLDTTQSYCWKKLAECGETAEVAGRCCRYFAAWALRRAAQSLDADAAAQVNLELPNLRSAVERSFDAAARAEAAGAAEAAGELAASFCSLLLQLSKLAECSRWAQTALDRLPESLAGTQVECRLRGALGQALMFTGGDVEAASASFRRSIEVAEALGDHRATLHLLNGYAVLLHRDGRFTDALAVARKAQSLLAVLDDPESRAIVDSLMGVALHLVGHVHEAYRYWERALGGRLGSSTDTVSRLGFDHQIRALCGVARSLWLTGHYARAAVVAEDTIARACNSGHVVTHCIALIWAGSVYVYADDVARLRSISETIEAVATQHSLAPYLSIAEATRGLVLVSEGCPAEGVERIRAAVGTLRSRRFEMVNTVFLTTMARGLADLSLFAASLNLCDEVAREIKARGDFLRMPELLTVRGRTLAAAGRPEEAAESYLAAIELARRQGTRHDQLCAALALARQWAAAGQADAADRLLRPHVIDAGDETSSELVAARSLLRGP